MIKLICTNLNTYVFINKKAYVWITPDYGVLDVVNKIGISLNMKEDIDKLLLPLCSFIEAFAINKVLFF